MNRYFRLLRPTAWLCFLLPFAVGFYLASHGVPNLQILALSFTSFAFWMSFSFTLNSIYDREVDRLHDGRTKDIVLSMQPLVTGEVSEQEAKLLSIVFLALSLTTAFYVSNAFFLTMVVATFVGYVYSAPPRFKALPVLDVVCNAMAGVLAFHAGLSIGKCHVSLLTYVAAFFLAATFYLPTAVADYEFDRKAGIKNTPVYFGPERVLKFLYFLASVTVVLWALVFVFSRNQIRFLALPIAVYTAAYTHLTNLRWDGEKLNVSPNVILTPFGVASLVLVLCGILSFG